MQNTDKEMQEYIQNFVDLGYQCWVDKQNGAEIILTKHIDTKEKTVDMHIKVVYKD